MLAEVRDCTQSDKDSYSEILYLSEHFHEQYPKHAIASDQQYSLDHPPKSGYDECRIHQNTNPILLFALFFSYRFYSKGFWKNDCESSWRPLFMKAGKRSLVQFASINNDARASMQMALRSTMSSGILSAGIKPFLRKAIISSEDIDREDSLEFMMIIPVSVFQFYHSFALKASSHSVDANEILFCHSGFYHQKSPLLRREKADCRAGLHGLYSYTPSFRLACSAAGRGASESHCQ